MYWPSRAVHGTERQSGSDFPVGERSSRGNNTNKNVFFLKYVTRDWADFVVITRVPLRVAVSIRGYVTGEIREKQTKKKTNNYYFPDLPSARIRT